VLSQKEIPRDRNADETESETPQQFRLQPRAPTGLNDDIPPDNYDHRKANVGNQCQISRSTGVYGILAYEHHAPSKTPQHLVRRPAFQMRMQHLYRRGRFSREVHLRKRRFCSAT